MGQILEILLNVISPIFIIIAIGALIGRRFNPDPRAVSTLLIYVFLPALAFQGVSRAQIEGEIVGMAIAVIGVQVAMMAVGLWAGRLLSLEARQSNALVLSVMLINAANYAIPFNAFAFGEPGRERAIIYWLVSVMIGNTIGVYFASRGTAGGWRLALKNVFEVPIAHATVLGLAANLLEITPPLPITRAIDIMADASIPAMIVLLGLQLARVELRGQMQAIVAATGIRLLISPVLALGFALALGLTGVTFNVTIISSAMPTAVVATAFALQFGSDSQFTSAVTLLSTLTSIITLTAVLVMLGGPTV